MIRQAAILIALFWAASAGAVPVFVCPAGFSGSYLAAEPASPDSSQQVSIVAGTLSDVPGWMSVAVEGNMIDVTLAQFQIDFLPPPPACMRYSLGTLPPGVYTVRLSKIAYVEPNPAKTLLTSTTLTVRDRVSLDACPSSLGDFLTVDPATPDSSQPVSITAGVTAYAPRSASVQVNGRTIDVTLDAQYFGGVPPPTSCARSTIGPLAPGVYTLNRRLTDSTSPGSGTQLSRSTTFTVAPNVISGVWWNPNESGWGISFMQRGSVVFAAWYTYDAAGNPKWYVAPHCALSAGTTNRSCTETLYEVNGPTFFNTNFNPSAASVAAAGSITLAFASANAASMTYTVAGQTRTAPISRQPFPQGAAPPPVDYTDVWWSPNESGWGVSITHQYDVMFLAWYVYDAAGKPVWYVAPNCPVSAAPDSCEGILYRTTGPAFGPTFDPSRVQVFPAGTVSLRFADANNASLTYRVNDVTRTKTITRQVF